MSQYATLTDLANLGLPGAMLGNTSETVRSQMLIKASGVADSYIAKRHKLPLVQYGDDLRFNVCAIASFWLLRRSGFNPSNPADAAALQGYTEAMDWLDRVARGLVELANVIDSSPLTEEVAPLVSSEPLIAWSPLLHDDHAY